MTTLTKVCPFCSKPQDIEVDMVAYTKWQQGAMIQDAFPELSPSSREVIKTGICTPCWDETFKETDE